jgi:RNA polymerase-binding transcription factor DksA
VTNRSITDRPDEATIRRAAERLRTQVERNERQLLELESSLGEMMRDPETLQEDRDGLRVIVDAVRADLAQTQRALGRVADGTYGLCTGCGSAIAPARLDAIPTVQRCARCA